MENAKTPEGIAVGDEYSALIFQIGETLRAGRESAVSAVNTALVQTYWSIGKHIAVFELEGKTRADYGTELFERLAADLRIQFGRGFSRSNLVYMRKLYQQFPICETLSHKLSWSHYFELLKSDSPEEILFYIRETESQGWSVKELKRQMNSMLFERLALSSNKTKVVELASKGQVIDNPSDIIRDPYVFDFLQLRENYLESDLESALIDKLEHFLLELGKGFAFVSRQYRISVDGRHFHVDLLFYHTILKCYVLIDLKRGEVNHQDVGQMNFYLNYFKKEENHEGDNDPIGIVLGASKHDVTIEYATASLDNQLFVSKYQLHLPDRKTLTEELAKLIQEQEADNED